MPLLVRSPEQIFRETRKDIYLLKSLEEGDPQRPGLAMILNWIKQEMPETHMELLAPSEYSGILEGGINGTTWVDFSPQGLKRFCHTWENDDGGSTDPRFQCYVMPYADWFEGHGRFVPTRDKPLTPGVAVWWYTPEGFIHHTLSEQERQDLQDTSHHPANERDIWAHLISLWPNLTQYSPHQLTYGGVGRVSPMEGDEATWRAWYTLPFASSQAGSVPSPPTEDQIRDWFCLPTTTPVNEWEY